MSPSPLNNSTSPETLTRPKKKVIIVGAGPVGLLTAIRLGQENISTLLLEKGDVLHKSSRAVVYNPIVLPLLKSFGVLDAVLAAGYLNTRGATWLNIRDEKLAHLAVESDKPGVFGGVLLLGQARLNDILLDEVRKYPSVEIKFGAGCTGVEHVSDSEGGGVRVMTWQRNNALQDITYEASYVVAADGAGSAVRRCLCVPYEGYTWPDWKMLSTHVQYDFAAEKNYDPITAIVDAKDWALILNTGEDAEGRGCKPEDAVWRVSFGEDPSLPSSKEDYMQRATERVGNHVKKGASYKVVSAEPYYLHQRCAAVARKGRVVFAGDALHANNPSGGLGLTTGICDAYSYSNALCRIINGNEPDALLTECAESRRAAFLSTTNPTSIMNFKRDSDSQDKDAVMFRNMFFGRLNNDPGASREVGKKLQGLLLKGFERPEKAGDGRVGKAVEAVAASGAGSFAEGEPLVGNGEVTPRAIGGVKNEDGETHVNGVGGSKVEGAGNGVLPLNEAPRDSIESEVARLKDDMEVVKGLLKKIAGTVGYS
ncbi:uncharacterized protein KY384_002919 [Bacidia gigantensis]|uniref:uncharacterized protein n=1 Tax=Bacidia gigantensis TaxID=2732470 RepID=UPI001D0528E6|nr:uncharacterized protein KY384_002919 [Bacidia gigantensis]KAG8531291.1 hypothetical protein KY384_002919 [Bacidia gigantensis]